MTAAATRIEIASAAFKADPFPAYARLRAAAPMCRVSVPRDGEAWLATRYEDVSALLKDVRLTKDPAKVAGLHTGAARRPPPAMFAPLTRNMLGMDDPDHVRLKRLVMAAFTPRRVETMTARTEAAAHALLDRVSHRPRFDLIANFALPLPVRVISDLLGVPPRDQDRFARWSRALIRAPGSRLSVLLALPDVLAFLRYLKRLIALKRAEPQDDLVSALVQAEEGERLDGDELMSMIAILLSAGHETTTNFIGNAVLALLGAPGEMERLRSAPWLMDTAVEELLRFAGPVETSTHRYALEPIKIAGVSVPAGALVLGAIASANRDARVFDDADRLDLGRSVNRHLTFGEGGHYCVGAALARLEGKIALAALLERLPGFRLAVPAARLRWRGGWVLRGLEQMPLSLTAAPVSARTLSRRTRTTRRPVA